MLFTEAKMNFLDWLELIKNKSPRTIEQYKRHLDAFEAYFWSYKKMNITVGDISQEEVNNFRFSLVRIF